MVLGGKFSQEYQVNTGDPQGYVLGPTLFVLYINDFLDYFICNTTFYSKCGQAFDLWQQVELAGALGQEVVGSIAEKAELVLFDWFNNTGGIDMKMDGSFLEGKSSLRMLGLSFFSKLDWSSYFISIAKTTSKKIGPFIQPMKFLSPEVALYLCKSTI